MSDAMVTIVMGSRNDWEIMQHASQTLDELSVPHEVRVLSAHRTPEALFEYMRSAEQRGVEVIIAAAGAAAHLAGVCAAKTLLPVLGVPLPSSALQGMDALLSTVQMPAGIPVGTLAIGKAGAINAALLAAQILARKHAPVAAAVSAHRAAQAEKVLAVGDPRSAGESLATRRAPVTQ